MFSVLLWRMYSVLYGTFCSFMERLLSEMRPGYRKDVHDLYCCVLMFLDDIASCSRAPGPFAALVCSRSIVCSVV